MVYQNLHELEGPASVPNSAARGPLHPGRAAQQVLAVGWRHRTFCALGLAFFLLTLGFTALPASADPGAGPSPSQSTKPLPPAHTLSDAAISPDGRRVAWTEDSQIFVQDLANPTGPPLRNGRGSQMAWSPDSRRLAFLAAADDAGQQQIYVAEASGGARTKLTSLTGFLINLQWSPDGKELAFLFTENPPRTPGPGMPIPPRVGVVGDAKPFAQRLALISLASNHVRTVSPAGLYVYEYDWCPDSKRIVATAAYGAGDDNWYVAQLDTLDVGSGRLGPILKPNMQITAPRWSPDGEQIAFIGGVMAGNLGGNSGDIYLIPAAGGPARNLTPHMKASAHGLAWLSPNRILMREYEDGEVRLGDLDLEGAIKALGTRVGTAPPGSSMGEISVARAGDKAAAILGSPDLPAEVWAGTFGAFQQITHVNEGVPRSRTKVESLHWKSDDWRVQGWITYPRDFDPQRRYPMVVEVHGGPSGMATAGCGAGFAAEGYFVLCPNFRGSAGFGEDFQKANVKDFGYGDLRDILAGVDKVLATLPVDKDRIGITGPSYGGYMTMWAVTQTQVFHAAVAEAGISNWLSYIAEAEISKWVIPYFGALIYDDPAIYARSAPITYIKNVKTPTLIIVGAGDGECPAPQSLEFWYALKTLGVDTELVIYPGEGHMFIKSADSADVTRRSLEWFHKYLK